MCHQGMTLKGLMYRQYKDIKGIFRRLEQITRRVILSKSKCVKPWSFRLMTSCTSHFLIQSKKILYLNLTKHLKSFPKPIICYLYLSVIKYHSCFVTQPNQRHVDPVRNRRMQSSCLGTFLGSLPWDSGLTV